MTYAPASSMTLAAAATVAAWLLGCGASETTPTTTGGGGGGAGAQCPHDACGLHGTREACCADGACSWHHGRGHANHGVGPCVSRDRICVVADEVVRTCPETMSCLREGAWQDTEDDCTLPEPGAPVSLLDRGICACD